MCQRHDGFTNGDIVPGRVAEARTTLAQVIALSEREYADPILVAEVYTALADRDRAFEWLTKCVDEHGSYALFLSREPMLDSLHDDPRWPALLARVGLPH